MGAPRETVESFKQGAALKIETLERIKEGTNEILDALIAQAHQESAAYEQLDEDLSENNRNRNGNANDVVHEIIALLGKELDCLKKEDTRCLNRYLAEERRVKEKYKREMDAADAANEDLTVLNDFKDILSMIQNTRLRGETGSGWRTFAGDHLGKVFNRIRAKRPLTILLKRKPQEERDAILLIKHAWNDYRWDLHDLMLREDRLGKAIELLETNFT